MELELKLIHNNITFSLDCVNIKKYIYIYIYIHIYIQGIHKIMVRLQKLTRNLFLTLHGHNVHRQQQQLSKFLMRYQQFASHAYCRVAGPVSKMTSQQEKAFCVLRFEVSRSVITVQREFRARFRIDAPGRSEISWQRHRMVVGCQPCTPAAFTPRKYSWYSFLLEAESIPEP